MKNKITLTKYKKLGADYHYQQINKKAFFKYNAFVDARYKIMIQILEKSLRKYQKQNKIKTIKILDLGCGDGVLLYLIDKKFKKIKIKLYGIDSAKNALKIAKKKIPKAKLILGKVEKTKFKNNFFDIALSSDVIEHLKNQKMFLKEIKRIVKKKGLVIIGTPIKFTEKPSDKLHTHEFFPQELENLAEKYFKKVKITKSHPLLCYLLYKKSIKIFNKKVYVFYVLINALSIFLGKNIFKNINHRYAYMHFVCQYPYKK
jgi:ubiquinone/menaquinone biosynthesis C-methylase UbiE